MGLDPNTVWEVRTTGDPLNGAGFRWLSLVNATYKWTVSGHGVNEYHLELAAGGNPNLIQPHSVSLDGFYGLAAAGALGALAAGQWAWGDNDLLGYSTLYVRLVNGLDPDVMLSRGWPGYVQMGYNGGQDYSQQAAAALSPIDIATDAAGTQLTSAAGGFTALMVGNLIYLTGGGATAKWYEIRTWIDGNNVTIDSSAGANLSNVHGKVGGAFALGGATDSDFGCRQVAGNRVFIGPGTHATNALMWTGSGDADHLIIIAGYHTNRGDVPLGDDKPLLDFGTHHLNHGANYTFLAHLRMTSSDTYVIMSAASSTLFNCKAVNTKAGAPSYGFYAGSGAVFLSCEATCVGQAAGNFAFDAGNANCIFYACYAHHAGIGLGTEANYTYWFLCVAADCHSYGIYNPGLYEFGFNNTFYDCAVDIAFAATSLMWFVNNILSTGTKGFDKAALTETIVTMNNCMFNGTDYSNVLDTLHLSVFGDPGLKNPAAGDFRVDGSDKNVYEKAIEASRYTAAVL